MTRDPFTACIERQTFVRPQKTFYPSNIAVDHAQLRQLLACPTTNQLYYVCSGSVYRLDTATKKRTHVVKLPFRPSCIAAAHGWLCVGGLGEGGHFATIKLPGPSDPADSSPSRMRHEQLGTNITNSISINRLPALKEGEEDDIVAVLTNNDNKVRIYSLTRNTATTVGEYKSPMNHASISPDGTLMFIVGDLEIAYFYERNISQELASRAASDSSSSSSQWVLLRKVAMHKPETASWSAYFTTTWSTSNRLCATASEHGFVTLIDTGSLRDPEADPIVAVVPSSRPNSTPGAIRALSFSPDPWDLLIWTENNGRMCVGDLRSGLSVRHVTSLDSSAETVVSTDFKDVARTVTDLELPEFGVEPETIYRSRNNHGDPSGGVEFGYDRDYILAPPPERHLAHQLSQGLTEQERQILDGLRSSTRQRQVGGLRSRVSGPEETHEAGLDPSRQVNITVNAAPPPSAWLQTSPQTSGTGSRNDSSSTSAAATSSSNSNRYNTDTERLLQQLYPFASSIRAAARAPNPGMAYLELERRRMYQHQARPTNVGSGNESLTTRGEAMYARLDRELDTGGTIPRELARSQPPEPRGLAAYEASFLRQVHGAVRAGDGSHARTQNTSPGGVDDSRYPADTWGEGTSGMCWDQEGRVVYVGTERGIFELTLDLGEQKCWPTITFR